MPTENYTSKFRVDVSDLKKGLADANAAIKKANAEFKNATAGTKDWQKSADGLTAAITSQRKVVEEEEKKLSLLKEQLGRLNDAQKSGEKIVSDLSAKYNEAAEKYGATSEEAKKYAKQLSDAESAQERNRKAAEKLELQIINQDTALKKAKAQCSDYETALDNLGNEEKQAETATDKLGDEFEETGKDAQKATDGGLSAFTVALGNLASNAITAVVDKLGEMGTKLIDLGVESLKAYGSYEQLVGGVDTLFKESSAKVQEYANNAFMAAGLSANDYLETVTGFSASLISSLGGDTAKSADIANQAIIDMSDNANKMGTDISSLQNAYQGFAKQNYTMLDNLKLGYGGTKEEMERLLADASKLTGIEYNIENFSDIIEAIHAIQSELDITGTTAKEASTTIEGSTLSMKSAFENFKVEIAKDNGDVEGSLEKLGNAFTTLLQNILPRVEKIIGGIQDALIAALPMISGYLEENASEIISTFLGLISNVGSTLITSLISAITNALPDAITALSGGVQTLLNALSTLLPQVISAVLDALPAINEALFNALPTILEGVINLISAMADKLPDILEKALKTAPKVWTAVANAIKNGLPKIVTAVQNLLKTLTARLPEIMKILTAELPNIIGTIADIISTTYPVLIESVVTLIQAVIDALPEIIKIFDETAPELLKAIGQALIDNAPLLLETAKQVWSIVLDAIPALLSGLWDIVKTSISTELKYIGDLLSPVGKWLDEHVFTPITEFFEPVVKYFENAFNIIKELAEGCWKLIKTVWNAASTWFSDNVIAPVKNVFSGMWDKLKEGASAAWDGIKSVFNTVADFFTDTFGGAWQKVKDIFSEHGEVFEGIKDGIVTTFKNIVNGLINGINTVVSVPFNNLNNILDTLHDMEVLGVKPFENLVTRIDVPEIPQLEYGGILKRGQLGLLEGKNDEAVIPLQNNTEGLRRIAGLLSAEMGGGRTETVNNYNFTQTNNSPKPLSRWDIYRQTKNLMNAMKGV